jgi:ankyrin repeat protein
MPKKVIILVVLMAIAASVVSLSLYTIYPIKIKVSRTYLKDNLAVLISTNPTTSQVEAFLSKYPWSVDDRDFHGTSALSLAVAMRRVDLVKLLLAKGALEWPHGVPNVPTGETPLHISVQDNDIQITYMLLEAGADPDERAKDGLSAIDIARSNKFTDQLELLNKYRK